MPAQARFVYEAGTLEIDPGRRELRARGVPWRRRSGAVALNRSLAIAEDRGDAATQLKLLGPLRMFHSRIGDFRTALDYAQRGTVVARTIADPAATALVHSMLGMSLSLAGDLGGARAELEAALQHGPGSPRTNTTHFGFDGYNMAAVTLAMILWLQGYPTQAAERARQSVTATALLNHPVTFSVALVWAIFVLLGTGDLRSAEEYMDWFISNAESHSLGPYLAVGLGFKGQLAICHGDAKVGVEKLRRCLEELHAVRYELLTTPFEISLAQGLGRSSSLPRASHWSRRASDGSSSMAIFAICQNYSV